MGTPCAPPQPARSIYAGWMSGYGNLVVVDHGNGLSTAYAHNSSLAVGVGQSVSAGRSCPIRETRATPPGRTSISRCGSTASAVDPLGYL